METLRDRQFVALMAFFGLTAFVIVAVAAADVGKARARAAVEIAKLKCEGRP